MDRRYSNLGADEIGQEWILDGSGWNRFKNDKSPTQLADAILDLRHSRFEEGTRIWSLYKSNILPQLQLTLAESKVLRGAIKKIWYGQGEKERNKLRRVANPNAKWMDNIRDWDADAMVEYFLVKLGGVVPSTGLKMTPQSVSCDRTLDAESRYNEPDTCPLTGSLNYMISAASNVFMNDKRARWELERRGLPLDTDLRWLKIIIIREWITSVVEANGGFI
ncbi:hypothetical protein HDU80_001701 [Chytriomyces hyalinus]|nr:hypothetical protein HDU80_001701 [Chytriomyces hyalinus]